MAPPILLLVVQEKKEDDSTRKYDPDLQEIAPPKSDDVQDIK
jgi:hypothetical protein